MEENNNLENDYDMEDMSEVLDEPDNNANNDDYILVAKIIYKSSDTTTYGVILLFIDVTISKIINKYIALSHDENFVEPVSLNSNYITIKNTIKNKIKDNLLPINFISDLETKLYEIFTKKFIDVLNLYQKSEYRTDVDSNVKIIEQIITKALDDKKAIIYTGFERVHKDLIDDDDDNDEDIDNENNESQNKDDLIKIQSSLVLSPVYGKPINQILENDVIMVRVSNTTEEEKNINTMFKTINKDGKITPIPATVVKKMNKGKEGIVFILKIIDNIYSVITETEPVKIQLYEDMKLKILKNEKKERLINTILLVLGLSVFVLSGVIIYFIINT